MKARLFRIRVRDNRITFYRQGRNFRGCHHLPTKKSWDRFDKAINNRLAPSASRLKSTTAMSCYDHHHPAHRRSRRRPRRPDKSPGAVRPARHHRPARLSEPDRHRQRRPAPREDGRAVGKDAHCPAPSRPGGRD